MTSQPTTETADRPFSQPLLVDVWHDPDTESPNDYDGLFKLISFSNRHMSYEDPETVLACQFEWTRPAHSFVRSTFGSNTVCEYCNLLPIDPDDYESECETLICESGPHDHGPGFTGEYVDGELGDTADHDYLPPQPIAAFLSYYEHGLGEWSRMGHGPADYGGFDTVSFAGVLIINVEDYGESELDYWYRWTDEQQRYQVDQFLDTYTDWANGETYGYSISEQAGTCPKCHRENDPEVIDSCGGFIGSEKFAYVLREELAALWHIDVADLTPGEHFTVARNDMGMFDGIDLLTYAKWADDQIAKGRAVGF